MGPNLTTLLNVKDWLAEPVAVTTGDALITRLIAQISQVALNYMNRPTLFAQAYSEVYDGVGGSVQMLRNWPVISMTSLAVDGVAVAASAAWTAGTTRQAGYLLSVGDDLPPGRPQSLTLAGGAFTRGRQNVLVVYRAGYLIQGEAAAVPGVSAYTVTPAAPYGAWAADAGVTLANGTALTKVTGAPAALQYAVSAAGVYTFNVAQATAAVLLSYSYVPAAVEQAVIEWIGERYRYRTRIGQLSKSLGNQETASYSLKDVPDYVALALQNYRRVVPL